MKFYHISTNLNHPGVFQPRIPNNRMDYENHDKPRICVANSIENCLSLIPGGSSYLSSLTKTQKGFFKLFEIDTEKIGVDKLSIIPPTILTRKRWVPDADVFQEYWLIQDIKVPIEDASIIYIKGYDFYKTYVPDKYGHSFQPLQGIGNLSYQKTFSTNDVYPIRYLPENQAEKVANSLNNDGSQRVDVYNDGLHFLEPVDVSEIAKAVQEISYLECYQ